MKIGIIGTELNTSIIQEDIVVINSNEPFIITAPTLYTRSFEDYKTGKERRRERRKIARK